MSDHSKIEWTDATWNPVTGCTKVSPGCDHCYAERVTERFQGPGSFATVRLHPDRLDQPLRWRKPRKVFVNSMSDLFHDDVPEAFIGAVFDIMAKAPQHTFQILTKRHARMRALLNKWATQVPDDLPQYRAAFRSHAAQWAMVKDWPLPNVWLGVSVEDQKWADIRIPALLETPAAVRFLSCEPLLGPVDLRNGSGLRCKVCDTSHKFTREPCDPFTPARFRASLVGTKPLGRIDWVIVGGESGPGARPMRWEWATDLATQCAAVGVAFHMKQLGHVLAREVGAHGKGTDPDGWPSALPREYPAVVIGMALPVVLPWTGVRL